MATGHGHAFPVVVDGARCAFKYGQRKTRQCGKDIDILVELMVDDNRHRRQLPSSFFCVPHSTRRSCHTDNLVQRTGTPHAEFPCCHFETGKPASIRPRRPKRWSHGAHRTARENHWRAAQARDWIALGGGLAFGGEGGKRGMESVDGEGKLRHYEVGGC